MVQSGIGDDRAVSTFTRCTRTAPSNSKALSSLHQGWSLQSGPGKPGDCGWTRSFPKLTRHDEAPTTLQNHDYYRYAIRHFPPSIAIRIPIVRQNGALSSSFLLPLSLAPFPRASQQQKNQGESRVDPMHLRFSPIPSCQMYKCSLRASNQRPEAGLRHCCLSNGGGPASPSTVDSARAHKLVITTINLLFMCSRSLLPSLRLIRLLASTHLSSTGTPWRPFETLYQLPLVSPTQSPPVLLSLRWATVGLVAVSGQAARRSCCSCHFHPFQPTYSARDLPDHCHIQTSARRIDRRYPLAEHLTQGISLPISQSGVMLDCKPWLNRY